jgi:hypothetical protein
MQIRIHAQQGHDGEQQRQCLGPLAEQAEQAGGQQQETTASDRVRCLSAPCASCSPRGQ